MKIFQWFADSYCVPFVLLLVLIVNGCEFRSNIRIKPKPKPQPQPIEVTHAILHAEIAIKRAENWEQLATRIEEGEIKTLHELQREQLKADRDAIIEHNERLTKLDQIKFQSADKLPENAAEICREIAKEWREAGK